MKKENENRTNKRKTKRGCMKKEYYTSARMMYGWIHKLYCAFFCPAMGITVGVIVPDKCTNIYFILKEKKIWIKNANSELFLSTKQ